MGYETLPLEIECKILDEIDWTETVNCAQVCTRWRDHLSKSNAHGRRYIPGIQPPESIHIKRFKSRHESHALQDFNIAMSEITVSITTDETEQSDSVGITGVLTETAIFGRSSCVLLHRFMDESRCSFGFFVKVDSSIYGGPLRRHLIPQGFFLIGDEQLSRSANSLGGRRGSLMLREKLSEHESSSEDSLDSEDEKDDASFNTKGRFSIQLNSEWHWNERVFNSPMCETEIHYGRGFESFKRVRRNFSYNPQAVNGKYLRRLSDPNFAGDKPMTVRQLVRALTKSVTNIKMLEPDTRERGGIFFIKFNGGRIELEIYEGVEWFRDTRIKS
ncbi:hypothetical protein H072_1838 [Dactylellina haptotyla CBS 200.50]|uniref:F-box domain-containing protein n=1 Tax=Dactylellina haptotyla (strain CBS 200.50) TaxID=1284197 RepID=S8C924_DACHA|nr:hypothetical protein H072_1838 [Dactylellina haptotyla CBS 200.50]